MQRLLKTIFWTSIVLIILLVALPIFGNFTTLEFTDDDFENVYDIFRFFLLPIAILLTFLWTLEKKDTPGTATSKILVTIAIAVLSIFMFVSTMFSGMCVWSDVKILFIAKKDNASKIVLRGYGCGATDSGSPIFKVFKVRTITSYLNSVTAIDTSKIDKSLWTRAKNEE